MAVRSRVGLVMHVDIAITIKPSLRSFTSPCPSAKLNPKPRSFQPTKFAVAILFVVVGSLCGINALHAECEVVVPRCCPLRCRPAPHSPEKMRLASLPLAADELHQPQANFWNLTLPPLKTSSQVYPTLLSWCLDQRKPSQAQQPPCIM